MASYALESKDEGPSWPAKSAFSSHHYCVQLVHFCLSSGRQPSMVFLALRRLLLFSCLPILLDVPT